MSVGAADCLPGRSDNSLTDKLSWLACADAEQLTCTLATKTTRVLLDVIAGNDELDSSLLQLVDSALGLNTGSDIASLSSCDLVDGLYAWLSANQEHIVAGTPIQRTVQVHPPRGPSPQSPTAGAQGHSSAAAGAQAPLSTTKAPAALKNHAATRVMSVSDKASGFRRSISAQSLADLSSPPSASVTPPPPVASSFGQHVAEDGPAGSSVDPPALLPTVTQAVPVDTGSGVLQPPQLQAVAEVNSQSHADTVASQQMQVSRGEPVTILYYHESMHNMAVAVARLSQGRVLLRGVDWGTFGDGWPNTFIQQVKDARYNDVAFLACLDSPTTWFAQVSVMICLPRYAARSLHVIIPYFQGTMERVDTPGQVATTAAQAHILSSIPPAVVGPPQITLLDLHNLTTTHYFGPGVHVRPKSLVPLLLTELFALPDTANISIAFPDEGAYKRFSPKFVQLFPTVVCKKRRLPNGERRVEIHDGEEFVAGRHVVIVDDLVQSGGTLLRCAEALRAKQAGAVSAYVSHGVFPNDSWKKFLRHSAAEAGSSQAAAGKASTAASASSVDVPASVSQRVQFKHFWLTDSIPTTAAAVSGKAPFVVLQCAGMVWDAILQYKQCLHGAMV